MHGLKRILMTAGACAGLGGCFIIPQPPQFTQDIVAAQLASPAPAARAVAEAPVAVSTDEPAVVPMGALNSVAVSPAASTTPSPPPAPPPVRTDIKGAGDGSMTVSDDRVIIRGTEIQQRAPNYSSEQAAAITCAAIQDKRFVDNALRAHAATVKAEAARKDFDAGRISGKQLDAIEIERQDAVINYSIPVPGLNWIIGMEKKSGLPEARQGAVVIVEPDLFTFTENGRSVTAVSGKVRNTSSARVAMPPVTLRALDEWEFTIAGQTSLMPFAELGPLESRAFEVRFLNPPANMVEAYIHFAPPFLYRSRRDCEFFDPSTFNSTAKLDANAAADAAGPLPADHYTSGELNVLTRFFRRESEVAWRCQADRKCEAGEVAQRLAWREMFVMAEAIDEAWVALAAAEAMEAKESDGEGVDAAREDSEAAMQRVRDLGAQALGRSGATVADVAVAVTQSVYGRDAKGLFVEVGGMLTNTSDVVRQVDALMVAFVDRLELPLSSVAVPVGAALAPGETRPFQHRLAAGSARGTEGVRMGFGEARETQPARIPSSDIAWQVRVGAVAKAAPAQ